ncbi:hypothetical protein V1520DRAFT_378117 [Lipomyces starkeyi]
MQGHYELRPYSRRGNISFVSVWNSTDDLSNFKRDGKCVITGVVNAQAYRNRWTAFQVAHIVPLSSEDYFEQSGFSRWITNRTDERDTGINSCQNGLLMQDNDGYKIICFDGDLLGIDGRVLDPVCRNVYGDNAGPNAVKRMEAELFSRLNGY